MRNTNDHLNELSPYSEVIIENIDTIPANNIAHLPLYSRLISFFSIITFPPLFDRINI